MKGTKSKKVPEKLSFKKALPFIEYLEGKAGLIRKKDKLMFDEEQIDRAALSDLRKDLGKPANRALFAMKYVARWTADFKDPWDVEWYYCMGTLFALYQQKIGKREELRKSWHHKKSLKSWQRNFGASFSLLEQKLKEKKEKAEKERLKTVEQRFTAVIRSRKAEMPVRLRHAILLLASYEISIDWVKLLKDLMRWKDFESSFFKKEPSPQRKWSEAFWRIGENVLEKKELIEEKK